MPHAAPRRALPLLLCLVAGLGACRRGQLPGPVVAMEPRPNPPVVAKAPPDNPRERLRQNRWLAQFWEELTPAQRRRVEARMRGAKPPMASDKDGAGHVWDGLGLAERDRLVFGGGGGAPPSRSAAPGAPTASAAAPQADGPAPAP